MKAMQSDNSVGFIRNPWTRLNNECWS